MKKTTVLYKVVVFALAAVSVVMFSDMAQADAVDINARDDRGNTQLHRSAGDGKIEDVAFLIDRGANINAKNEYGNTPLHFAVDHGKTAIVALLISKGAELDVANKDGNTALMRAVESDKKSNLDVLKLIIEKGADINLKNIKGETALIIAARSWKAEMVSLLIKSGGSVSEKDNKGKSAWTYAVEHNDDKITALLEEAGSGRDYEGMEWEANSSAQKEEFIKMVTTKKEWAELWRRAFDKPAPDVDFKKYAVACAFLGHHARWGYSILFTESEKHGKELIIYCGLGLKKYELKGRFKAYGQYRMKVFKIVKGHAPLLKKSNCWPAKGRIESRCPL
jgi:ankyrin repeat protein